MSRTSEQSAVIHSVMEFEYGGISFMDCRICDKADINYVYLYMIKNARKKLPLPPAFVDV